MPLSQKGAGRGINRKRLVVQVRSYINIESSKTKSTILLYQQHLEVKKFLFPCLSCQIFTDVQLLETVRFIDAQDETFTSPSRICCFSEVQPRSSSWCAKGHTDGKNLDIFMLNLFLRALFM